jgi:hypothetical protein
MDPWPERVGRDGGGLEGRSWDKCGAGGTRGKEGKTKNAKNQDESFLGGREDHGWVRLRLGWMMQFRGGLGRSKQARKDRKK